MISLSDILNLKPQRVFLVQGGVEQLQQLHDDAKKTYNVVQTMNTARFGVDDARILASFASEGDGTERICIVYFSLFSPDAAQILLKSLEEPAMHSTIILVTPYPYTVPMTIRSRVALLHTNRAEISENKLTRVQALDYIKRELSSEGDDDAATRRANAVALLDTLELQCKADPAKARTIYEGKHMMFVANMPTKFVMEYVVSVVL